MEGSCIICGSEDPKLACQTCFSANYCSVECQQTDLDVHSLFCEQYRDLTVVGPNELLAVLFPSDQPAPKLIRLLRGDFPAQSRFMGTYNALRGRSLADNSRLWLLHVGARQAEVNQSIQAVTHQNPAQAWRGSIVVTACQMGEPCDYRHINAVDIRNAVDFFAVSCNAVPIQRWPGYHLMKDKARGVRVNCEGDTELFAKKYVEVEVPKDHPVFSDNHGAPISYLVEMPVHTWLYPPHRLWKDDGLNPYQNESAMLLRGILDRVVFDDLVPHPSDVCVGSILVVREDKQDLTAKDIAALCDYCQYQVNPKLEETLCNVTAQHFQNYKTQQHVFDELTAGFIDPALLGEGKTAKKTAGEGPMGKEADGAETLGNETDGSATVGTESDGSSETIGHETDGSERDGQQLPGKEAPGGLL